jgi:hypothetical protein
LVRIIQYVHRIPDESRAAPGRIPCSTQIP